MSVRVAINGFGRIGRNVLRAIFESNRSEEFEVVAINDLSDPEVSAHLFKYDTTHGQFKGDVSLGANRTLVVNGQSIRLVADRDPKNLHWGDLGVDVLLECTGSFCSRERAALHQAAGAKKVLISAPAGSDMDATIVYGVNHSILKASDTLVSNASCTTNCLAPIAKVLNDAFGIEHGLMNTIHSFTNDQVLIDVSHKDVRRARSATQSMIPTKTGAAKAVGLVLPELDGKLDGFAVRVPTINVSVVDFTVALKQNASIDAIHDAMKAASEGPLSGVLAVNDLPLVSVDFNHHPASSIYDATQTKKIDSMVKIMAWYDNEWGFSNRMLDTALAMMNAK